MISLAVNAMGAVTAGGNNTALSVASIYTSTHRFERLEVDGVDGHKVVGARAAIGEGVRGADRLAVLGRMALRECAAGLRRARLPVVVCAPALDGFERDAGWLLDRMLSAPDGDLPIDRAASRVVRAGRGGEVEALAAVAALLRTGEWPACFLLGVDSLTVPQRLVREVAAGHVASGHHPTGFLPGEAGAALLLSLESDPDCAAVIAGAGQCEGGPGYKTPAAVLAEAADHALADAHVRPRALGALCHDGPGSWEQLEELALADGRPPLSLAPQAQRFIPAIATGEVGAASGVLSMVTLSFLLMQGVLRRPTLAMFSSDGPARGAAVLVPGGPRAPRGVNDG